jgi:hypothetical protein
MTTFADPEAELAALAEFDFSGQDEQFIREHWIYPLLRLLGYGLGTIDIPFKVDLRPPVHEARALGSYRWEIDYRPTVHGRGLWIIEAKRPSEDLTSGQHLGQAWGYATHPLVDVPLMMLANGSKLRVFDVTQEMWDSPILEISQAELPERFGDLNSALGARSVAEFVRQRQLRHLRSALAAQVDYEALDQTLLDVQGIVNDARIAVTKNRASVQVEAMSRALNRRDRDGRAAGVGGLAQATNSPHMGLARDLDLCSQMIIDMPAANRTAGFDEIAAAAAIRSSTRMTFALRMFQLGVALRLVGIPGVSKRAKDVAGAGVRAGALNFPDDPLPRAAHIFEMTLTAMLGRTVLAQGTDAALAAEQDLRSQVDTETWLRMKGAFEAGPEVTLMKQVEIHFRLLWFNFEPWSVDALDEATVKFSAHLDQLLPQRPGLTLGHYEQNLLSDPLPGSTYVVVGDVAGRTNPIEANKYSDEARTYAESLLETFFPARRA